ncbi:penicillin acylase family protein [Paraglaciecola aestuariivivens]
MLARFKSTLVKSFIAVLSLLLFVALSIYLVLLLSLPQLEGTKPIVGLKEKVSVTRDAQGMATLSANNRLDLAYALGVVHAQERFFQMDLLRRHAAGELSELFGELALKTDKNMRMHRFSTRAKAHLDAVEPQQLALLKAYAKGVNQGIDSLTTKPFEYYLLNTSIKPWSYVDSGLVMYAMYQDLQGRDAQREINLSLMHNTLAPDLFAFLTPKGSRWDAAIDGSQYSPNPIPTSPWPTAPEQSAYQWNMTSADQINGSNNWAVAGQLTADGRAIVANDMHLGIGVPNIWYRATLEWQENNQAKFVSGVTLPGTPAVVVGSNGKVAWGFTNSQGDWTDIITLAISDDAKYYQTAKGMLPFQEIQEVIRVKGQDNHVLTVQETQWGPVIATDDQGNLLVRRWVAHDRQGLNLNLMKMENVSTVQQAFDVANTFGQPAQNLMVADYQGNIGWTIAGPIPKRATAKQDLADYWHSPEAPWQGYLPPEDYPRVYNHPSHRLWTANARVVGNQMLEKIGTGGYALGARQQQIRDGLMAMPSANEQSLFQLQLDDKAVFLQRWRELLLAQVLDPKQDSDAHFAVKNWSGHASVDDKGYLLVHRFRITLRELVFEQLANYLIAQNPDFKLHTVWRPFESPLWQLVNQQPAHLLPEGYNSWNELMAKAWQKTKQDLTKDHSFSELTWGDYNGTDIRHPLSSSVPFLAYLTDMPKAPQAGDSYMPRVASPKHGASQRMVVAPGFEEQGIMQMPASQTGHPLSPYYGKGHDDWLLGKPSAFLAGEAKYTLELYPAR